MASSPQLKLKHLIELRKTDWVSPDYRNSLNIISDTTYQDRKHFLLELIQNADDADYDTFKATITFIIESDAIELRYNEVGFSFEDVFAITGTGHSTKKRDEIRASSFIGEKGIGFKSVFALARDVEIESPPWHFYLTKDNPITPLIIEGRANSACAGTRLRIRFMNPDVIEDICTELEHYVSGSTESFLFLQKLSAFNFEDRRYSPPLTKQMEIIPSDRQGDRLRIRAISDVSNEKIERDYVIYSEQLQFPAELVTERWDKLTDPGPLKRTMSVAALLPSKTLRLPHGRLFCFLPTNVSLPVPLYLQVDGHTTASRERLHDLNSNHWNQYLIQHLPKFLLQAILSFRSYPETAKRMPDYVPTNPEMDQLATVFTVLIDLLGNADWIRSCDEKGKTWFSPQDSIIADSFIYKWVMKDSAFRQRVEAKLGKKLMHPDWAENQEWLHKWAIYGVEGINQRQIAIILSDVPLPSEMVQEEETLLELYKYILNMDAMKMGDRDHEDIKTILKRAPIYPFGKNNYEPLVPGIDNAQVFYLSTSSSQRSTGMEGLVEYRLIHPEYTYKPKTGEWGTGEKREQIIRINERNKIIRELLGKLDIQDLDSDALLSELQIPWLLDANNAKPGMDRHRFKVLGAIFEAFSNKREPNEEYLNDLYKLEMAPFLGEDDQYHSLRDLTLPPPLRLEPGDDMYGKAGTPYLVITGEQINPSASDGGRFQSKDVEVRTRKHREEWRDFLIKCGLRVRPGWTLQTDTYETCSRFRNSDYSRWQAWTDRIKDDYTEDNPVEVTFVKLDGITTSLLSSSNLDMTKMANTIYESWLSKYNKILNIQIRENYNPLPGYFNVRYKRRNSERTAQAKDKLWAGIDPKLIPLITIEKIPVPAGLAGKIEINQAATFKTARQYLTMVAQTDGSSGGYHARYLESLNLSSPTISDINLLWDRKDPQYYNDIIQVAIELLKMNVISDGLLLYDKDKKQLRPYDDFRLGKTALAGIPLIEKQYGEAGRILGHLLKLHSESKLTTYMQLLEQLYAKLPNSLEQYHAQILGLLDEWASLDETGRQDLVQAANKSRKKKALDLPIVITYNQDDWAQKLKNAGYMVLSFHVAERQKYKLERAAHELGFSSLEEEGQLKTQGENNLNEYESQLLIKYLKAYEDRIEAREIILLEEKLAVMGKRENLGARIKRVKSACREIELGRNTMQINIELPFLELQCPIYLVKYHDSIQIILAGLLSVLEFAPYHSVLRDLQDMQNYIEPVYQPPQEPAKDKPKETTDYQRDPLKIAQNLKDGLVDDRPVPLGNENTTPWKTGFSPDEEENFRNKQLDSYMKSLEEGPKEYEKKARMHNQRTQGNKNGKLSPVVDSGAVDPRTFLLAEYDGYCQICGIDLPLSNGSKWIETYRIVEKYGQEWLGDRPFNILGFCPNCHALAKHGGGSNFSNLLEAARDLEQGHAIPQEVKRFNMDCYVVSVRINGKEKLLYMSKLHLNHLAVVFTPLFEVAAEIAATEDRSNK